MGAGCPFLLLAPKTLDSIWRWHTTVILKESWTILLLLVCSARLSTTLQTSFVSTQECEYLSSKRWCLKSRLKCKTLLCLSSGSSTDGTRCDAENLPGSRRLEIHVRPQMYTHTHTHTHRRWKKTLKWFYTQLRFGNAEAGCKCRVWVTLFLPCVCGV